MVIADILRRPFVGIDSKTRTQMDLSVSAVLLLFHAIFWLVVSNDS